MKTAAVHPALLPFLCVDRSVDARPQAAAGLFEQFSAKECGRPAHIFCKGVWATRPHSSCVPARISAKECGRPAHIYPVYPPTFILRPAHIYPVYPPTFILCTCKGGRVALPPLDTYQQRCFLKRCSVKTADALREADEKRGPGTT